MTENEAYQKLIAKLYESRRLGIRTAANGAILIGHVPHVAPEAWLHELYPPLSDEAMAELETAIQRPIPEPLRELYRATNGLSMFSGSLSIYGKRGLNVRTGDEVWQPFNLATPNTIERPRDAVPDAVFFGGLRKDGSKFFMKGAEKAVYLCPRGKAKDVLQTWESLPAMLLSEYDRLSALFDEQGRKRE